MESINYSLPETDLLKTMDQVCEDHKPIIITREAKPSVVLISLEDYQSLEETLYLLSSPKNAKRLLESISQLEAGKGIERELLD